MPCVDEFLSVLVPCDQRSYDIPQPTDGACQSTVFIMELKAQLVSVDDLRLQLLVSDANSCPGIKATGNLSRVEAKQGEKFRATDYDTVRVLAITLR